MCANKEEKESTVIVVIEIVFLCFIYLLVNTFFEDVLPFFVFDCMQHMKNNQRIKEIFL